MYSFQIILYFSNDSQYQLHIQHKLLVPFHKRIEDLKMSTDFDKSVLTSYSQLPPVLSPVSSISFTTLSVRCTSASTIINDKAKE